MNFNKYMKETVDKEQMHDKLRKRYLKSHKKLMKARDYIMDSEEEFEKIQKIMKRHKIKSITNYKGQEIFNADEEISVWDNMA